MALKVKSIEQAAPKWAENAGRSAEEYVTQAIAAAEDWARNTAKAANTYGQAIAAPGIKTRFLKGVQRAGAAKYSRKVDAVARDRFAPGIVAAESDYKTGVEPYLSTLAALTLTARKPRGDPANYRRVEEIGKALNAKRLALLGGGAASAAS